MSKIRIATDSTADIPKSFCEELGIAVLPLMAAEVLIKTDI